MQNYLLNTCEILLVVVVPLLVLYLKGNWLLRKVIPPLVVIPVVWYFTYAPLHEFGHATGVYLVGGKVIDYKLIPRFWLGEFGGAWITPSGITQSWQQLTMTAFPYMLDIVCLVVAIFVFRRGFSRNPFLIGLAFMLLCLRPASDFVFEPIAFLSGDRNDFYAIQQIVGPFAIWSFILISIGLSVHSISSTLSLFVSFSKHWIGQNTNETKHNIVQGRINRMNNYRSTAVIVGILYIIGTVAGILSRVFSGSILGSPDYLAQIAAHEHQIVIGALFVLMMGLALAAIPAVVFPVLRKQHEGLAVGYVIFRGALETFTYIAMTATWLLLIVLSQEYVKAGAPAGSSYQSMGSLVLGAHDSFRAVLEIVFPLGALMFYTALYRSQLVPRWISDWGLAAAAIWLGVGISGVFGLIDSESTLGAVLSVPIGVQEMAMAVWLIVKGFNPSPVAFMSTQTAFS